MRGFLLIFKTFWSPGAAFKEIAEASVRPWAAILVLTIVGLVSAGVITTIIPPGEMALLALEQSPRGSDLTEEQKEQVVEITQNSPLRFIGFVFPLVGPMLLVVFVAAMYFGIFMILGSSAKYRSFFSLTSFAMLPLLIRNLAATLMVLFIPASAINIKELGAIAPSTFLDPAEVSQPVFAIALSLDLISLWILILLIFGYKNITARRTSAITRTVAVLMPWLVFVAGRAGLTLLF